MKFVSALVSIAIALFAIPGYAEPTGGPVKIRYLRPYNNQSIAGSVIVVVDQPSVCGTDVFLIDLSWNGSKELVAAALGALLTNATVQVEAANTGCTGTYTKLQSIYVFKP